MAQTPENIRNFLFDLRSKLEESGKKELQMLLDFKHECGEEGPLEAWDFSYYMNKLKEKLYHVGPMNQFDAQVDVDLVKEYFPTEHVITEMMKIYQEIFGFVFKE